MSGMDDYINKFLSAKKITIIACGTSWHSALVAEYMFEKIARIPVEVEYASEFRYRDPVVERDDVIIAISQSGETADTVAALKKAKDMGALTMGICNVVGSTISRETDCGIYTHAGPEIGVASTKAFTTQLVGLLMLTIALGRRNGLPQARVQELVNALHALPEYVQQTLELDTAIKALSEAFIPKHHALFLGRGIHYPVAMEGSLKLKEISYIHAEAYPAGELKHGPLALVDDDMPVVAVAPGSPAERHCRSFGHRGHPIHRAHDSRHSGHQRAPPPPLINSVTQCLLQKWHSVPQWCGCTSALWWQC